jgi:hypothetical protein
VKVKKAFGLMREMNDAETCVYQQVMAIRVACRCVPLSTRDIKIHESCVCAIQVASDQL